MNRNIGVVAEDTQLIESDLFQSHENSRFALGVYNSDDISNYQNNPLLKGYLQLRANVYIDQAKILGREARQSDGTETDIYDRKSVHFVAFEKRLGGVGVVASSRMIFKDSDEKSSLPVEKMFNGGLYENVPNGSIEVSRFIMNHNEREHRADIKARTIMAQLAFAMLYGKKPLHIFAAVEERFKRELGIFGVPSYDISEPEMFEEGGGNCDEKHLTELIAVRIRTDVLENRIGREAIKKLALGTGEITFWGDNDGKYSSLRAEG